MAIEEDFEELTQRVELLERKIKYDEIVTAVFILLVGIMFLIANWTL